MGRESTRMSEECSQCGGYGFTVQWRCGRRYPYPCSACGIDQQLTALEAQQVLSEHGEDLRTTFAD
jgi:hypothetical protein